MPLKKSVSLFAQSLESRFNGTSYASLNDIVRLPIVLNRISNAPRKVKKTKNLTKSFSHPLKLDPTRTAGIRKRFEADIKRRLRALKKKIRDLVYGEDAFGLLKSKNLFQGNDGGNLNSSTGYLGNQRYAFLSSADKLKAFQEWLKTQIAAEYANAEEVWRKYIAEGFSRGAGRAFQDVRSKLDVARPDFYKGTMEEFLQSSFARPIAADKLKLLTSRVFTELKGVTESMSTRMTSTLADGLVEGQSPRTIARDLAADVEELGVTRSRTIARTEVIRAHAEGQLLALEDLGVTEVGVMVEWVITRDEKVCPKCEALEGVVMSIEDAKGKLPLHPNCRCAWVPAGVGETVGNSRWLTGNLSKWKKDSADFIDWLLNCGGPGSGVPGPCPTLGKGGGRGEKREKSTLDKVAEERQQAEKKAKNPGLRHADLKAQLERSSDPVTEMEGVMERYSPPNKTSVQTHGMTEKENMREVTVEGVAVKWNEDTKEAAATSLASILVKDKLPEKLWEANESITFSSQANSEDATWEKEYGIQGFVSVATGGEGHVVVYNARSIGKSSLAHESAHNLAEREWGSTDPPPTSLYGRAQAKEAPVTGYGKSSPAEDFAEACAMYTSTGKYEGGRARLQKEFPLKYEAIRGMLGNS